MAANDPNRRPTNGERMILFEVKLDQVMEHLAKFSDDTTRALALVEKRLNKMDLNGHAQHLRDLADATPELLKIVPVITTLQDLAGENMQKKIFNRELIRKLRLNSKFVRGLVTAMFGAFCYIILDNIGATHSVIQFLQNHLP